VRSLSDNVACTASITAVKSWEFVVLANESELLINVVIGNELKLLSSSNQNGKWSGSKLTSSFDVDVAPPAKRQSLTHEGTHAERGRTRITPFGESDS
jgi:hypothetical protein